MVQPEVLRMLTNETERSGMSSSEYGVNPGHCGSANCPANVPPPASHHALSFCTRLGVFSQGATFHAVGCRRKQNTRPLPEGSSTQSVGAASAGAAAKARRTNGGISKRSERVPLVGR